MEKSRLANEHNKILRLLMDTRTIPRHTHIKVCKVPGDVNKWLQKVVKNNTLIDAKNRNRN